MPSLFSGEKIVFWTLSIKMGKHGQKPFFAYFHNFGVKKFFRILFFEYFAIKHYNKHFLSNFFLILILPAFCSYSLKNYPYFTVNFEIFALWFRKILFDFFSHVLSTFQDTLEEELHWCFYILGGNLMVWLYKATLTIPSKKLEICVF